MGSRAIRVSILVGAVILVVIVGIAMSQDRREYGPVLATVMATRREATATLSADQPVAIRGFRVAVDPTHDRLDVPHLTMGVKGTTGLDTLAGAGFLGEADWQLTVRLEQIDVEATAPQAELSLETVDP